MQLVDYDDYTKQVKVSLGIPLNLGRKGTVIGDLSTRSGDYVRVKFDDAPDDTFLCDRNQLQAI